MNATPLITARTPPAHAPSFATFTYPAIAAIGTQTHPVIAASLCSFRVIYGITQNLIIRILSSFFLAHAVY